MPPTGREPGPLAAAVAGERRRRLRDALHRLPETAREVFLLRQNGDLTYAAIAGILGIPEGTAKTRMRAALARLKEVLAASPGGGRTALEDGAHELREREGEASRPPVRRPGG